MLFRSIECAANCIGPVGTVVYFKPRVATVDKPVVSSGMIQMAAVNKVPETNAIVCVAGCYAQVAPQPIAAPPLPAAAASLETAVVVSSADVTPTVSVPTTRSRVSIGGLRRVKSRVRHARMRHQWLTERASVVTTYAKSYRAGYRAF